MPGVYTNGLPLVARAIPVAGSYNAMRGYELLEADTERPSGAFPQSVAPTSFQIAALGSFLELNTATDGGSGTATNSRIIGQVISGSLSTAAGSNYTMTLTNTTVTALSNVQACVYSLSNTTPGITLLSITPAAGSVVFVVRNNGVAALNGTIVIFFQVMPG